MSTQGLRWTQSTLVCGNVIGNLIVFIMHVVYILKCKRGRYYTGCTSNLEERIKQHSKGVVHYTKDKLPVELVCYIAFSDRTKAFQFEKYLKSGSGIALEIKD